MFDGEYLNGKKWKGKFYDHQGKLIFDGEKISTHLKRRGKEYNDKGELIFEGEYFDGRRYNGKGKETFKKENISMEEDIMVKAKKLLSI